MTKYCWVHRPTYPLLVVLWAESVWKVGKTDLTPTNLNHRAKVSYCPDYAGGTVDRSISSVTIVETSRWNSIAMLNALRTVHFIYSNIPLPSLQYASSHRLLQGKYRYHYSLLIPQNFEGQNKVLRESLGYVAIKGVIFFCISVQCWKDW